MIAYAREEKDSFLLPCRIAYTAFSNGAPITSYGCIVRYQSGKDIRYLLVQRRDSAEFNDFIRGGWSFSQLPLLLSNLTVDERRRVLAHPHQELWKSLSGQEASGSSYAFSEEKNKLVQDRLPHVLERISSNPEAEKNSWVFPKGRPEFVDQVQEEPLACAIREFGEETNKLPLSLSNLVHDRLYYEEYTGTNSKRYRTEHFLFLIDKLPEIKDSPCSKDISDPFPKSPKSSKSSKLESPESPRRKAGEIGEIRWTPKDDLAKFLNERRLILVQGIEKDLQMEIALSIPDEKVGEVLRGIS
jgi:8-oxo-dGTP pyrophosphatase MutT (NUDIX family)